MAADQVIYCHGPLKGGVLTVNAETLPKIQGRRLCRVDILEVTLDLDYNSAVVAFVSAQYPNPELPLAVFAVKGVAGDIIKVKRTDSYLPKLVIHTEISLIFKEAISGKPLNFRYVHSLMSFQTID